MTSLVCRTRCTDDAAAAGANGGQTTAHGEHAVLPRRLTGHPHFRRRSPFFVLHGRNDSLVPVQQARGFVDQLRQVSKQPVVYAELPFTQHAFDLLGSARAAHTAIAVEQFLAEVYATQHAGSEPGPAVAIP